MRMSANSARSLLGAFIFGCFCLCPAGSQPTLPPNSSIELTFPLGPSPMVFTQGWKFGAKCFYRGKDLSAKIKWSGTAAFSPALGPSTSPVFKGPGLNTLTASVQVSPNETLSVTSTIFAVSPVGYATIGDLSWCAADSHGAPGDPLSVTGPITVGSSIVTIQGKAAARVGDSGTTIGCSGPNTFQIAEGDPLVLINGKPAARHGDRTNHCGGVGVIKGDKPSTPYSMTFMDPFRLPNGDSLGLGRLIWSTAEKFPNGGVKMRSCQTTSHLIWQTMNAEGQCVKMTVDLLEKQRLTYQFAYEFFDAGSLKSLKTTLNGFGKVGSGLAWHPNGSLRECVTYYPWVMSSSGYMRANGSFATWDEYYEDGKPSYRVRKNPQGDGSGERWLRDGRLWFTEKHVKNVITDKTYLVKPEDVKSSDF